MHLNPETTIFDEVTYLPSTHCDSRPEGMAIELIVLHNISLPPGCFGGTYIDEFFCGKLNPEIHPYFREIYQMRVAPHLFINRTGAISQYVPLCKRAWHAGKSCFHARNNCNDFSIGIELEGTDDIPYTKEQYQQLALITKVLLQTYAQIKKENIVGHCDIAPDRKTDPGTAFAWDYFFELI